MYSTPAYALCKSKSLMEVFIMLYLFINLSHFKKPISILINIAL